VAVQPITAMPICFVARIAASRGRCPSRRKRAMFSTTTIESSTSRPRAMTKPTMLSWLMLQPSTCSPVTPMASESGMETITTSDARRPSGSSVTSTGASAMAKSQPRRDRRSETLTD
jgi:hypothetical protein